jgi:hypothetical protein
MKALKSIQKISLVNVELKSNLSKNLVMKKDQVSQPLFFNSTLTQSVAREDFSTFHKSASRNIFGLMFVTYVMLTGRSFVIGLTARLPSLLEKARIYFNQNRISVNLNLVLCVNCWGGGMRKKREMNSDRN